MKNISKLTGTDKSIRLYNMHDLGDPKFFNCCFHLFPLVLKKKWLQFQDDDGDGGDDGKKR